MKPILPAAATEQHIAILGKTGSGKTTAAKSAVVEPLLAAGRRVGVVDPTGAWWGLRTSRDGKKPGYPVLVLGGDHGDMPLVPTSGAAVVRPLVEQGINLVADTSMMTVGERTRWFIDFAGTVYRANRSPLTLVLDEAHNFAPQGKVPDPETGRMLHAANSLASGGRSRGIRLVMATQRPQKLHKDALTSADTLIAMRVLAPQDRSAIEDWIKGAADIGAAKEVLSSLAGLPRGTGWVWYPEGGFLQKVAFPPAATFDSSAAPLDGAVLAPKGAAEIDLTEIKAALADAVKEAAANDPKLLRARIAELEKQVGKPVAAPAPDPQAIEAAEYRGRAAERKRILGIVRDGKIAGTLTALLESSIEARVDPVEAARDWQTPAAADGQRQGNYGRGAGNPTFPEQAAQWMTPDVPNGGRSLSPEVIAAKGSTESGKKQVGLENQVKLWPTPVTTMDKRGDRTAHVAANPKAGRDLMMDAQNWPSPMTRDYRGGGASLDAQRWEKPDGHARLEGGELFAPGPADHRWARYIRASRIGAWERAVTDDEAGSCPWAPATKPGVRMLVDGMAIVVDESRRDQLRAVGNGVVPLQAAAAIVGLIRRLTA